MTEISKEYGSALFMLSAELDKMAEISEAMELVSGVFLENPEYLDLLSSPVLSTDERLKLTDEAFSGRIEEDVLSFLKLLCEKKRMDCFFEAYDEFRFLVKESMNITEAKITSSLELDSDEKDKIIKKLEKMLNKTVKAEYFIDKSLLGGVVIEVDGKVIDASIRGRLQDIKEVINK